LNYFVEGGVQAKDPVTLQAALRGFESALEFVWDAWRTVCQPITKILCRESMSVMDDYFLRYLIEMAIQVKDGVGESALVTPSCQNYLLVSKDGRMCV